MKLWIKILIAVGSGFAGGFAAGFFTHKKLNDVQFEEISEEEMKEIEKTIEKTKTDPKEDIDHVFEPKESILDKELPEDPDELKKTLQGKTPYIQADKEEKTRYETLWRATKEYSNEDNANQIPTMKEEDNSEESEEDKEFDEDFLDEIADESNNSFVEPPHVISLSDFYNDRPEFDKVTIDWFEPDDVWLDENEEFIEDISSYVGVNNVKGLFAENSEEEDPDIRFIRNEQYGSDYEIIRHHKSWEETTGGVK